ncbi:MAG: DUF3298 domain-containing protein [Bacteroidales bacterium]|nr:DUF3298 domain-containing protein [Bacteroidales bacterium]
MKNIRSLLVVAAMSLLVFACHNKYTDDIIDAKDIEFEEFSTTRFPEFDANLEVAIYFMLPKTGVNEKLDSIYADLVAFYTDSSKREIQSGIEMFADSIEAEYFTNKEDIGADISGFIYAVNYYDSIYPVFADGKLLAYINGHYEYQGGAHGLSATTYSVYNLATGKRITEDDIFVMNDTTLKVLSDMIEEAFGVEYSSEIDDLWEDDVNYVNGNFCISADSLFYQYQPYEIGPYAMGMPRVALHKDSVKSFLKKDGPLYEYWYPEKKNK